METDLTGGVAYDYNYVTVTGACRKHHLLLHCREKRRADRRGNLYHPQLPIVKMLYVGDPQIGASKGQPEGNEELSADAGAANTAARNDSPRMEPHAGSCYWSKTPM
ncbi:MAG: hypothetical protein ACLRWQ_08135 [Flavonifractor plautii]